MKINFFNLIIEILTILSIIFALAVITSTNPVIAISFLIALFLTVAFYLILMGLNFIGLSYLLIYIGAITVLVLFIVMMISSDILHTVEVGTNYSKLLPLSYIISILFLVLFFLVVPSFIIDFTSFELYNLVNNLILFFFNIINYNNSAPYVDNSLFSYIGYNNLEIFNHFDLLNNIGLEDVLFYTKSEPMTLLHNNIQIQTIGQSIYGRYAILLIASSFILLLATVAPIILNKQNMNGDNME